MTQLFDEFRQTLNELGTMIGKATGQKYIPLEDQERLDKEREIEIKRLEKQQAFENLRAWKRARLEGEK